ncbi:MAG: deoxyhypusine synthase family protein [Methanomassiliicoccales archaeon]|nr:MAG: deoxyhypusine synthase family protein [Methanomassiliicoccales archaeon]
MMEDDPKFLAERKKLLQTPINQIQIHEDMTIRELVDNFCNMSIQARNIGRAAKIWEEMLTDEERPTIFMGLAGPLIAAGLRNILSDIIWKNMVDAVVSTGAIVYQDLLYARGGLHHHGSIIVNDKKLRDLRINRIYDVFTDDTLFFETDDYVDKYTERSIKPGNYSSREFLMALSREITDKNSILKACYDTNTPIFVPAINDSSIGIGLTKYWANNKEKPRVTIDSIKDNYEMVQIILNSKSSGAVYIGGGVPKNFINDAIVMANFDFGALMEGHKYAIQVSTAIPMDGGLSGSTFGEATAWGKVKGDARKSMVYLEASIGLPLIYGYLSNNDNISKRSRMNFQF